MDSIGGGAVSLGDLADLTVTNDNELSCDVSDLPMSPWCPQTCSEHPLGSAVPDVSPNVALSVPWALLFPLCPQTCSECPLGSAVPIVSPNVALSIPWAPLSLLCPQTSLECPLGSVVTVMSPNPHDHPPWTTPVPITSL